MASFPSCTCAAASSKNSRGTREGGGRERYQKKGRHRALIPKQDERVKLFFFFVLFFLHSLFWSPLV
ncbi:hypothetical protein LZ32DRAFT_323399 [Colletotrichum eremochloae]|nr:hypothetical protein LZ32DRAFT_323399 [Colletotrichum eremochloae]